MKAVLKAILGILVILVIVGCQNPLETVATNEHDVTKGKDQEGSAQPGYESPVPVVVTKWTHSSREADNLPAGCSLPQSAAIVATFVDAFNRGDQKLLGRLFQPLPESRLAAGVGRDLAFSYFLGETYAKNKGRTFDFDYGEKDRLLEHFAERRRLGERMQLWKVRVNGGAMQGEKRTASMEFLLSRHAPDLKPGLGGPERLFGGKGSIDCENQTIFRWTASMEMVGGEELDIPPAPWIVSGDTAEAVCKEPPGWKPGEAVLTCT